jgi:putative membrane protein
MTAWQFLARTWPWEPSVVLGCGALAAGYLAAVRGRIPGRAGWFMAGVAMLLLALESPIDTLGDTYLFSAHMLQHLLLVLIVPPLLLLGLPPALARWALRRRTIGRLERILRRPVVAWVLGVATVWVWHIPALYNVALANYGVHVIQHLSFLATSIIFWWPICAPLAEVRMNPLAGMLYLLAAALACSGLGIILTFASPGLYPLYLHYLPEDPLGILPLIRDGWGLTPAADQQLGGLLMWVPGGLVYLCAIMMTLARWYREAEQPPAAGSTGDAAYGLAAASGQRRESHVA